MIARANRNLERFEELEAELGEALPERHRALTLPIASAAIPAARIDPGEADEAAVRFLESFPADWEKLPDAANQAAHLLGRTLATDERREGMRRGLAELARTSAEDFPLASAALESLLSEPMPEDPAEDDLWVNLVVGLVEERFGAALGEEDDWGLDDLP